LSVVLYGCTTWSLILRKEIRLTKVLSSVALKIILLTESKGYKIAGGKGEFLTGQIHTFCSSPNSTRLVKADRLRLARYVARVNVMRNSCRMPATKPLRTETHL
jgi:hypothetical protein